MKYTGIAIQQRNNNIRSLILLTCFPLVIFALLYMSCFALGLLKGYGSGISLASVLFSTLPWTVLCVAAWFVFGYFIDIDVVDLIIGIAMLLLCSNAIGLIKSYGKCTAFANDLFWYFFPYVTIGIFVWFVFAYFVNVEIIDSITGARALERRENKRVYNLVENLCISCGMRMPAVHVIEDPALNAFASGINPNSYTVTLTRGIIDTLDDRELKGVIAHELTHIRNNDVRVLIISIVFVGIFELLIEWILRISRVLNFFLSGDDRYYSRKKGIDTTVAAIFMLIPAIIGYCISTLMRFAISRKREFMADAGAATLTKDPKALASALRKISQNSVLHIEQESIAQLFIEHKPPKQGIRKLLATLCETHPTIEKRIQLLEWF